MQSGLLNFTLPVRPRRSVNGSESFEGSRGLHLRRFKVHPKRHSWFSNKDIKASDHSSLKGEQQANEAARMNTSFNCSNDFKTIRPAVQMKEYGMSVRHNFIRTHCSVNIHKTSRHAANIARTQLSRPTLHCCDHPHPIRCRQKSSHADMFDISSFNSSLPELCPAVYQRRMPWI